MKKLACLFISACLLVSLFAVDFAKAETAPKVISYATKPMGTAIYFIVAAMASIFNKHAGLKVRVDPVRSIQQWGPLMESGRLELAMDNAVASGGAYRATGLFKVGEGRLTSFRLLAGGHQTLMVFWTRPDTGIKSIEDLAGKRVVGSTPPGAPNAVAINKYLVEDYYKLKGKYKKVNIGNPAECTNALIEGKIDAYLFPATPFVKQLNSTVGARAIPIPKEAAEYVAQKVPGMHPGFVPKGMYGLKKAVPCIAWRGQMFAKEGLDTALVYKLLDTLYSHLDELHPVHPVAKLWVLENATKSATVPFHPGAVKFYKDKGIWTPQLNALQKKLEAGK